MKKSILILVTAITVIGLVAFSYKSNNETDFLYNVDSRFGTTITKEKLQKATSVLDIVPKKAEWSKIAFKTMSVTVMQEDGDIRETGENELLNAAQTKLLGSAEYSTHFNFRGTGKKMNCASPGMKNPVPEELEYAYYFTVVPEKEAAYADGYEALIAYLKDNSKTETRKINKDKLRPGRVNFTVSKNGTVSQVSLDSSCGYHEVDQQLVKLISDMPGKWNPATDVNGKEVDQKLVFFFGMEGC